MQSLKDLKDIIDAGGDPNELVGGMSYIHLCINENDGNMITYLIDKGCDPNTPKCTSLPHPIHYALKLKKNKALRALLSSGKVNPNQKTNKGVPALIVAVTSGNTEAVKILLEYEADPNVTNPHGEIALFHAINQGDAQSCAMLLDYQSKMNVGAKTALHFAIKVNQPECLRLLLEHDADRSQPDINGNLPIDLAMDLADPTIELLLYSREVPPSTLTQAFVKHLYQSFEENEVEEVRDIMIASPSKIPLDLHNFIDRIIKAERCHNRFIEFLTQRIEKLDELIAKLSNPGREFLDKDIDKLSKQLRNSFIKRIDDSTQHQKLFEDKLMSPLALDHFNQWKAYSKEMQEFIDCVIDEGILKFGVKDEAIKTLERSKKEIAKVRAISKEVIAKTQPFQVEIADFIDVTVKKLIEIKANDVQRIQKHFKVLIRQIEKTNPDLIRSRFKKGK